MNLYRFSCEQDRWLLPLNVLVIYADISGKILAGPMYLSQLHSILCRTKAIAYGSDSGEEDISLASPDQAFKPAPGLNDMEMEIANELRALRQGIPSTTGRRLSANSSPSKVLDFPFCLCPLSFVPCTC